MKEETIGMIAVAIIAGVALCVIMDFVIEFLQQVM